MAHTETELPAGPADQVAAAAAPAYELTDPRGHRASVWWGPGGSAVVEADDPQLRRRVRRALRRPLWVHEDAVGPDGLRSSYACELEPTDPRYPIRLRWNWPQIGLSDVAVRVLPSAPAASPHGPRV